ncbi:MAG: hypothetical protein IPH12_19350, partial [Saprospirales bacterium]|nr:hypothetical protein [Saprospirales bacterium]
ERFVVHDYQTVLVAQLFHQAAAVVFPPAEEIREFFYKTEIFLHPDLFCQRDQGIYRKIWYRLCLCLQSSLKLRFQEQKYLAGIGYFLLNCPVETTKYPKTAP